MKLVTYNTQYGVGRDGKFDLGRIAREVEGADIIALQEVTRNFARNGSADMIDGLAALLRFDGFMVPACDHQDVVDVCRGQGGDDPFDESASADLGQ